MVIYQQVGGNETNGTKEERNLGIGDLIEVNKMFFILIHLKMHFSLYLVGSLM